MTRSTLFHHPLLCSLTGVTLLAGISLFASSANAADIVCSGGYDVIECNDGTQFNCSTGGVQVDCTESIASNTSACDGHGGLAEIVNGGITEAKFGFTCRVDEGAGVSPFLLSPKKEIKSAKSGKDATAGGKSVMPDPNFMKPCEIHSVCVGAVTPITKQKASLVQAPCNATNTVTLVGGFPDIPPEALTLDNVGLAHNSLLDEFFDVLRDIKRRGGSIDDKTRLATARWLTKKYDPKLMAVIGPELPEIMERSRLSIDEQIDLDDYECQSSPESSAAINSCEPKAYDLLRTFFEADTQAMDQDELDAAIDDLRASAQVTLTGQARDSVLGAASVFESSSRYWSANGPSILELLDHDDVDVGASRWPWDTDGRAFCTSGMMMSWSTPLGMLVGGVVGGAIASACV